MSAGCTSTRRSNPLVSTRMVRLRPFIFFPPIDAALAADFGRLHTLTIHRRNRWLRFTSHLDTDRFTKSIIHFFERAVLGPLIEIVANGTLVGKITRDHAPLATSAVHLQQGVEDRPTVYLCWAPRRLGRGQDRFNQDPLAIC